VAPGAADARRLLADPDPVVRGRAALSVATAKDPADYDAILAVARDEEPEARLRGLVALGSRVRRVPSRSGRHVG